MSKLNLSKNYKFIVFTDLHLPIKRGEKEFENFLTILSKCSEICETIILLGDIFEVWSSVSLYNHQNGLKLLEEVEKLRKKTEICLVEGNWDFFICKNYGKSFSECSEKFLNFKMGKKTITFVHGHYFGDIQTTILNFILTNPVSYLAWKTGCLKNLEKKVAEKFLNKETSPLPEIYDLSKAEKKLKKKFSDSDIIICGHFHEFLKREGLVFLKDYKSSGQFYGITEKALYLLKFEREIQSEKIYDLKK